MDLDLRRMILKLGPSYGLRPWLFPFRLPLTTPCSPIAFETLLCKMSKNSDAVLYLVHHIIAAWNRRDVDETMRYMAPHIDYYVNVDPDVAPFAASTQGAAELRARLQLLLDTFHIDAFVAKDIRIADGDPNVARMSIAYFYREKTTNERLDGRIRFTVYVRDGLIVRIEELHDSSYVEAFARLVKMMHDAADDIA